MNDTVELHGDDDDEQGGNDKVISIYDENEDDHVDDFLCDQCDNTCKVGSIKKHQQLIKSSSRGIDPLSSRLLRLITKLLMVWLLAGCVIFLVVTILGESTSSSVQPRRYTSSLSSKPVLKFHSPHPKPSVTTWTDFLSRNGDKIPSSSSSSIPSSIFQIMHITDIHLGEAQDTDWGPQQDWKTWKLLDTILLKWERPDLIVLGGDQLTANNCQDHNCTAYYQLLGEYLTQHGIPWATILGNHDDMPYQPEEAATTAGQDNDNNNNDPTTILPHNYTRRQLLEVDASFDLSMTQIGPRDVTGASNYVLHVMDDDNDDNESSNNVATKVALEIYLLDSGGGTLPQRIDESQVHWFHQQLNRNHNALLPAIAFQHIPTMSHLWNTINEDEDDEDGNDCIGFHGDNVNYIDDDAGLVNIMIQSGRFQFLAVGHNHGNDYCCSSRGMYFCFGRHSGYGGYGNWQRGVRMYELQLFDNTGTATSPPPPSSSSSSDHQRSIRWRSWVRLESGAYVDYIDFDHNHI